MNLFYKSQYKLLLVFISLRRSLIERYTDDFPSAACEGSCELNPLLRGKRKVSGNGMFVGISRVS